MSDYILAHDLGTTGNKATLYDREGALRGSASARYGTTYARIGWAEQNPEDWWQAVCSTTQDLLATCAVQAAEIACVVFSGQMQGVVALDAEAKPLRPAIIWADLRATTQVAELAQRLSPYQIYQTTGHRLSAAYSLPKIMWIRGHQPEIYAATHKFMHAKDAMVARLTGVFATEPSDASGMNLYDLEAGQWSEDILRASEIDRAKLPQVVPSTQVVGHVRAEIADEVGLLAGTPVVIGGGDGACASVGAGSVRDNVAYSYVGSSAWIATAASKPIYDPQQRTMTFGHVIPGLFIPIGTMQAAGTAFQWMVEHLAPAGTAAPAIEDWLARARPGANNLLFLPYLLGERSPHWNPDARAAFLGLTIQHEKPDMMRAVLEGVAFNLLIILDALRHQGVQVEALRVIGGGTSNATWCQIMADVYGVPVQRLKILEEATSMGAAVVGGVGVGLYPDFSMAERMNAVAETIAPDLALAKVYEPLYAVFEAAYTALEPIYKQLAALG